MGENRTSCTSIPDYPSTDFDYDNCTGDYKLDKIILIMLLSFVASRGQQFTLNQNMFIYILCVYHDVAF